MGRYNNCDTVDGDVPGIGVQRYGNLNESGDRKGKERGKAPSQVSDRYLVRPHVFTEPDLQPAVQPTVPC